MNINKRKYTRTILIVLTTYSLSFFSNAAIYDFQGDLLQEQNEFSHIFSYDKIFDSNLFQPQNTVAENYRSVIKLIQQKKFLQAKIKSNLLLENDPKQAFYYNLKAIIAIQDKDFNLAATSYKKAIKLNPKNPQAHIGLSSIALEKKQLSIAKKHANKALRLDSNNLSAYIILAKLAIQQQDVESAEKQLLYAHKKAKGNLKNDLVILKLLSQVYLSNKQLEKILPLAEDLANRNKSTVSALSFLANIHLKNKNNTAAEQILRQIISLNSEDIKHRVVLAKLLSQNTEKDKEVLELLDQAVSKSKNISKILALKTAFLIKREKYVDALQVANHIEEKYPKLSIGKISKGDVFLAEEKYSKALNVYQQAYQISNNTKVLGFILKIFTLQNKQQEAIDFLRKELAKNNDNTRIQFMLANLLQNSNQYSLATKHYETLLKKQKNNVLILNNLAWVYSQQNNPQSLRLAEKAFTLAPQSSFVADTYGYILLKKGELKKALEILKGAAKMTPALDMIQLHLAEALILNQKKPQARKILQHLINQNSREKAEAHKLMNRL